MAVGTNYKELEGGVLRMWNTENDHNESHSGNQTGKDEGYNEMGFILMPLAIAVKLFIAFIFFAFWLAGRVFWFIEVLSYNKRIHREEHKVPDYFNDGRLKQYGKRVRERYMVTEEGKLVRIE